MLNGLRQQFHLHQWSYFATHIHKGILDIVFHSGRCDPVAWTPSPCSDHFFVLIQMYYHLNSYYFP